MHPRMTHASDTATHIAASVKHGLHEVRCAEVRGFAAAASFALGLAAQSARNKQQDRIIWIMDPAASVDAGLPFPDGLAQHGINPCTITFVRPLTLSDALWAADQAARCGELSAVIIQVKGNPKPFDLTASRRLMLRARESKVLVCVLRQSGDEEASAATTRWHVEVTPSIPDPGFPQGIGTPLHHLTLERNRHGRTGHWPLIWNPRSKAFEDGPSFNTSTHRIHRLHTPANRPDCPDQVGKIVGLGTAP